MASQCYRVLLEIQQIGGILVIGILQCEEVDGYVMFVSSVDVDWGYFICYYHGRCWMLDVISDVG